MCYELALAAKWDMNGNNSKMRLLYEIYSRQKNSAKPVDDDPNMQIILLILSPSKTRQDNNMEVLLEVLEQWACILVDYNLDDGSKNFAPLADLYDEVSTLYHIAQDPGSYYANKGPTSRQDGGTPSKSGSVMQRRQALLRSTSGNSLLDGNSNSSALEAVRKGMREVMGRISHTFLYRSPQSKPMCEVLWYNNCKTLRSLVAPLPCALLQDALMNTTDYLPCDCCIKQAAGKSKPTAEWEDISIVYSILLESSKTSVSDWLQKFAEITNESKVDNLVASRFSRSIDTLQLLGYSQKQLASVKKIN